MLIWIKEPLSSPDYHLREAVAYCQKTGAVLHKSRKQWTLLAGPDYTIIRHWQRAKVGQDQILERAQKSLDKLQTLT